MTHGDWTVRVLGAALFALCACGESTGSRGSKPPLVVVVVLDTLAAGHVSHLGYDRETTPNLDRLAQDGITFEQAISPAAYTVASIPSILTGRLPDRHGLTWYGERLPEHETTIAELLEGAGYRTFAAIGVLNGGPAYGTVQGFDEGIEVYLGRGPEGAQTLEVKGRTLHVPTADEFHPIVRERLDRFEKDELLFMYLHVLEPHDPYDPPLAFKRRFQDERFPGPYEAGDRDELLRRLRQEEIDRTTKEEIVHLYDSNILWADENLGRFLDELRARDLYEGALIIVTADHGEAFWQHGRRGHGKQLYEEQVRVPLVVKPPADWDVTRLRVPSMVSTLDIVPSLCEWLELVPPENELDGKSLEPFLGDPGSESRHDAIFIRARRDTPQFGLRTPTTKVIWHQPTEQDPTGERVEIYDLIADPGERHDLARTDPVRADRLRERIRSFLASLGGRPSEGELHDADLLLLEKLGYPGAGDDR